MPGNYPKRNKLHLEHGESLKTRVLYSVVARIWDPRWLTIFAVIRNYNSTLDINQVRYMTRIAAKTVNHLGSQMHATTL